MGVWRTIFELLFSTTLFVKGALFIPQIWRILKRREAASLSLATFLSMNVMQLLMIIHAFLRRDWLLFAGVAFSLLTSGMVTGLIIYYRLIKNGRAA